MPAVELGLQNLAAFARCLQSQGLHVGVHQYRNQLLEANAGFPAQFTLRLGGVGLERVHLCRPEVARVDLYVVTSVQPDIREGRLDELKDILKRIRDAGVMVGISAHDVELVQIAEDEAWDVDYYMTAFYNLAGAHREFEEKFGHAPLSEVYLREHRERMCAAVRQADKPCIAFKVLAAGRLVNSPDQIRTEFEYALNNIKPTDSILVGMYQKWGDQIGQNAETIANLCAHK